MPVILALRRQRQENHECEVSPGCISEFEPSLDDVETLFHSLPSPKKKELSARTLEAW
jgi:hypothetical protein